MKRLVPLFVATVALLGAPLRAAEPVSIVHDAKEIKTAVTLTLPGQVKIVLPGRSEAGYQWQTISNDPRIVRANGEPKLAATAPKDGSPRPWEVTFVAQRPGRSIVRFVWTRPGVNDTATPDEFREVTVRVQ
jgi:hypothetical protein